MLIVPIAQLPNQTFDILLDNNEWDFALYTVNDFNLMCVDISLNGNVIVTGQRCVPGRLLIPYPYLESYSGNFFFVTFNDEYPNYEFFNLTQVLVYASNLELEVARGNVAA